MQESVADHVLTLERAALDRWGAGDPDGYLDVYAPTVSYFDPATASRIDGLQEMRTYYAPWAGKVWIARYEIHSPHVVASDDMVLLTYNLVNFTRAEDGTERELNRWNSTAVYQRQPRGEWKIVHAHWSYTQPALVQGAVAADTGASA